MKVLLNDSLNKEGIKIFAEAGITVDTKKRNAKILIKEIGEFDALIVRSSTIVTREVIESGVKGNLKIIGRAGIGYDNIDTVAASQNGIVVKNAPWGNINATAELSLALMLNATRNITQAQVSLKKGVWSKKSFEGRELSGKTLGIIGCGRIGQRLSELVIGFNMEVVGYDPVVRVNSRIKFLPKEEVLKRADYVSVHASGTRVIIGEKEFSIMKPTAYLVNTSRGHNVDEEALFNALESGKIAGAGLDVYENEPKNEGDKFNNKLQKLNNVVISPHLGASTKEAQLRTSIQIAQVVTNYLKKGDFSDAVNVGETIELEEKLFFPLFVYHDDKPGMFAKISKTLADHGVNIRENPSRQIGDGCAIAVYLVHQKVEKTVLDELNKLKGVHRAKA
ncbi:ACT domain-containing protein [Candidatus Bathyarchaeota archaeon]|nr:ACT domain-containing protein [Candidatus Bathyarchaeota archaeon]